MAELARHIGASSEDVVEALEAGALRNSSSLDTPGPTGEDGHAGSQFGAGDPGLAEVEGRLVLTPLLARLGERDRLVLNLRFVDGWSQTQIGALIGATQMQVSRMLARSLAQLRAWSEPESA
jgi:RNA polymerase sigma-B factor